MMKKELTFGVIVGTRSCFSAELARLGREQLLARIQASGHRSLILPGAETPTW